MKNLTPDDWIVLNLQYSGEHAGTEENRIMMTFRGGYADGQQWRLSTNILSIKEEQDRFYVSVGSGKTYVLLKTAKGRSAYMNDILRMWMKDPSTKINEIDIVNLKEKL